MSARRSMLLLRGGRIVDPSQQLDEIGDVLHRRTASIEAVGRARRGAPRRRRARDDRLRGTRRVARASSTCTAICASRDARRSRRSRPARAPRRRADSPPSARCRTPIPVTDNQAAVGFIISQAQRAGGGARVSDRRDLHRREGRDARRIRRDGRRGRRRRERRRQAGRQRAADAHRARVRAHLRHSRRRSLRGADARRRRRDERGDRQRAARPQGHSRRGRGDHGDPRHAARAAAPVGTSTSAT